MVHNATKVATKFQKIKIITCEGCFEPIPVKDNSSKTARHKLRCMPDNKLDTFCVLSGMAW